MIKVTENLGHFSKYFSIAFIAGYLFLIIYGLDDHKHEAKYNQKKSKAFQTVLNKTPVQDGRTPASLQCDPSERGFNVTIDVGEVAYLDESTNIDTLTINGELHCDEIKAPSILELRVKTIIVNGIFQCGTNANPYNKKLIISLKDSGIDPKTHHGHRGIIVNQGGKLILNGERQNAGWYKLSKTLNAGDTSLFLDHGITRPSTERSIFSATPTLSYKVGDQIVVGPTSFNYEEAEKFTITSITNNEIGLDHPASFTHFGNNELIYSRILKNFYLDERAEVANLTRSILIRADEQDGPIDESTAVSAQIGGHIMVHYGGQAFIDSVELYKMGQAGVMGRYPFHWHWVGDVNGQYIKNSSIHHSFQRCVTVHRTHSALVQNNVCYDFKGHGYFLEDGNEINNKILHNLAIKAKPPSSNKLLLQSDNVATSESQGRFPSVSAFWISNPKNIVKNNVASGYVGTGFWMSFENEVKDSNGVVVATPIKEITLDFSYNTAHSGKVGITWDGAPGWESANNPNNPNDKKLTSAHYEPPNIPTFTGLKAFKNLLTGIYFRGNSVIYNQNIVADNGWNYWLAYNQIIKNSVFIGKTTNSSSHIDQYYFLKNQNTGRLRKTGIVLYDGPFEIHRSDFINYSTSVESYTYSNGSTVNRTTVPFSSTGGTNKFTNYVSDLYFSPEPIHRMHNESSSENPWARQNLANATIRDFDGKLSGTYTPSVLVATRSLGITPQSGCSDGGEKFKQFKVCPSTYKEGSLTFMRWGGWASPWGTPFVVKRSDGALSYPKEEWNYFPNLANNLFATTNSLDYSYELLPYYQYQADRNVNTTAHMDANFETDSQVAPVVKIVAYGNNCRLEDGAIKVNSLNDLKNSQVTAYYTLGKDFYVRVIPKTWWNPVTKSLFVQATAYTTMPIRHAIKCDDGNLAYEVLGKIEKVTRNQNTTDVEGFACNFTHTTAIKVKLFAYGPVLPVTERGIPSRNLGSIPRLNGYTFIKEVTANLASAAPVNFKCGKLTTAGRSFKFEIPKADLAKFNQHKFYVKGISNSNNGDVFIEGSGIYSVKPIDPIDPRNSTR